jgi:hypothetical protein
MDSRKFLAEGGGDRCMSVYLVYPSATRVYIVFCLLNQPGTSFIGERALSSLLGILQDGTNTFGLVFLLTEILFPVPSSTFLAT